MTTAEFVALALARLHQAGLLIDEEGLRSLAARVATARPPDWTRVRLDDDPSDASVLRDILLFASQSGGFYQRLRDRRELLWEESGSGSRALLTHLRGSLASGFRDFAGAGDIPFAGRRRRALAEVLGPRGAAAAERLRPALQGRARFAFEDAAALATLLPWSFGGDPFAKKAVLALMIAARFVPGAPNAVDLPLAADSQIPRVLVAKGVLPPRLLALLPGLTARAPAVVLMRAATVAAGARLAEITGGDGAAVDAALSAMKDETAGVPKPQCSTFAF